ncbi:MAG: hypothetical protein HYU36_20390 [Planctomycetes bacterium]|nr:hypothetical protein [Planctomycetota bacterium]
MRQGHPLTIPDRPCVRPARLRVDGLPRCGSRTIPRLLAVLLIAFAATLAAAEDFALLRQDGLSLSYHPRQETQARASLAILQRARRDIARRLLLSENIPAHVVLVPSQERFDEMVGQRASHHLLGVARSSQSQMLINLSQLTPTGENTTYETLAHEMTHIMLGHYEHQHGTRLPRWFHEGVALWLTRTLPPDPGDHRLRTAASQGMLIPFYELDHDFPDLHFDRDLAYLQSEDFIRFLTTRHGSDAIGRILGGLASSGELRTAVPMALGVDLLEEQNAWSDGLRSSFPFLRLLWDHLSLFTAAALLTVLSFLLYRRRRARRLAAWDREPPPPTSGPPSIRPIASIGPIGPT